MTKRKIYFWADASATIGYGHFVRTLALADMLKDDFECTFFTTSPSAYQIGEIEKVCTFVALKEDTKFEDFLNRLTGDEIVVLDNYFFTTEFMQKIKDKGCKLVCIDDMHDRHYVSDVVINHVLTDESLFSCEPYTRLCLGMSYALLRKPFLTNSITHKENGHWFVCFGGADFDNMTEKYVSYLDADNSVKSVTVVIGDAYKFRKTIDVFKKVDIKKNLSAVQMQKEMSRAEYAVLPSSSVCIEAISCHCKIASGYFVDNQMDFANLLADNHMAYPLGNLLECQNTSFIPLLQKCYIANNVDFTEVPSNYIKMFNDL